MQYFDPRETGVPRCPSSPKITEFFSYPLIVWTYMLLFLMSLFFAIFTGMRYNSVPVYIEKGKVSNTETVRKNEVSNTLWIMYFIFVAFKAANDAIGFSLEDITNSKGYDLAFVLISVVLAGGITLFFSLSLNHQLRHRSAYKKKSPEATDVNTSSVADLDALSPKEKGFLYRVKKILLGIETPLILLAVLYQIAVYALFQTNADSEDMTLFWVYVAFYALQRLPIFILLLSILIKSDQNEGPSAASKALLSLGVFVNLVGEIPLTLWSLIIGSHSTCWFNAFGPLDVINVSFVLSHIFLFFFLRAEFIRNKENCVWTIVSKRTDFFDFRDFGDSTSEDLH
eukprot:TRINITY_DN5613_c0_g1_i1.p1 TRINITY_DN5613_c0_g1~~TRINITY_DN5613_c0_g1_i1.p1  ORF type:complete len:341 (+),score=70.20 TRINITY_DN5613_c0_g1_i1:28-1050(+)